MFENWTPQAISLVISASVAAAGICVNLFIHNRRVRLEKEQIRDEVTKAVIAERLRVYPLVLQDLEPLSKVGLDKEDHENNKQVVEQIWRAVHGHLYGSFALISSHETREMIVRFRAICLFYLDVVHGNRERNKTIVIEDVQHAAWKVHQMLRSDLGRYQPGLKSNLELRREKRGQGDAIHINRLANSIQHNYWSEEIEKHLGDKKVL